MSKVINKLRTRKEKIYSTLALTFGVVLWICIILVTLATLGGTNEEAKKALLSFIQYPFYFIVFRLISGAVYRATAFGNMILLGPEQFPELYAMVVSGSRELGMNEPPTTFLYNSHGLFNAFARRLLGGKYVFLTSALVEANNEDQVRFVIGHELGHHAAGHLNPWLNFLKLPSYAIPFLMRAYSRSCEYSCDNMGVYVSKDVVASRSSLQMLGCGCRRLNQTMNCEAFMAQEDKVPPIFGFLSEIYRRHPRLTRRVAAINERSVKLEDSGA
ncbi:MAG: M48 family metallopeptidase [Alphaproteobacteria bacterium]|nr:M48 family metallopeptidase [Alphaproteobacteria bacterium]